MTGSSPSQPTTPRLGSRRLGLVAGIVAALVCGMVLMSLLQRQHGAEQPPTPPLPPLYEVQGDQDALQQLQLPTGYAGIDRTPPAAVQPSLPPQTVAQAPLFAPPPGERPTPMFCPQPFIGTPPFCTCPPGTEGPTCTPKAQAATPVATTQPRAAAPGTQPGQQQGKKDEWLFLTLKRSGRDRQGSRSEAGGEEGRDGREGARRGRQSQLFPAAQWERPARPERVIYSSQIMNCLLEQAIRTGHDGTVRCKMTETLYDKFGQLEVLVPLHSLIMGEVKGANVKPGQTTVPINVTKVELPDGADLPLTGKMGGADGISGVPGKVDNRIPQVILTAVLTAATSIGARSITGSPDGFQPSIGQEMTADAAQSLSRSGQDIMRSRLSIDPVINVAAQSPVTIQLDANVSLQSQPRIVYR
jgi:type IV secretory pathway VirB10-like protein